MKKFLFLVLILTACSDDNESGRQLYYLFLDEHNIPAIGQTSIEPQSNKVVAIHISDPYQMVLDPNSGILYLSTGNIGEIHKIPGNNIADIDILHDPEMQAPTEMAIDPGRNRIYWFDQFYGTISMASLDGKGNISKLFGGKRVADNCSGMAVDTHRNILYFTDRDVNKIFFADLAADGQPAILLSPDNAAIDKPKDLVISGDGNTLYWPDGQNHIMKTDIATKTSAVLLNSSASALYMDLRTNSLYIQGGPWIFKASLESESPKMTQVFETSDRVLGFVVR